MKKQFLMILLIVVCSLYALWPLFHPGFFVTDDAEWMIIRLSAFYTALHDGQFPVRFLHQLNFGYGYPAPTFLYPGFLYASIPFVVLDFGLVNSIKIILGLSLVSTTVFVYLWLAKLFSRAASFVGALLSLYMPYHLYDVYTRGSVGEIFALVWVPFTLWMLERRSIFFSSLGIFLLIISHNTLAALFIPFLFLYAIFRGTIPLRQLLSTFFLGIMLASFFIVPVLIELQLTLFNTIAVSDPLKYFAPFALIGWSSLVILAVAFLMLMKKKSVRSDAVFWLCCYASAFSIFLSSSGSILLWQILPSGWIQFPFRLLSYLIISIPFLAAFILSRVRAERRLFIAGLLLVSALFSVWPYSTPKQYSAKEEGFYQTNEATTTVQNEYMPKWVKEKPMKRAEEKVSFITAKGTVQDVLSTNTSITFKIDVSESGLIHVNTIFWPGWQAFIDNKQQKILYTNSKGLLEIVVPKGKHNVRFTFSETPVRLVADGMSILAFIGLVIYSRKVKKEILSSRPQR